MIRQLFDLRRCIRIFGLLVHVAACETDMFISVEIGPVLFPGDLISSDCAACPDSAVVTNGNR